MDKTNPNSQKSLNLRKKMDGVLFAEGPGSRPATVVVAGETHYRFHDFIYISKPLDELTEAQVLAVCSLRSSMSTSDQLKPNKIVRRHFELLTIAFDPGVVLEVGPGNRPLFRVDDQTFDYELAELDEDIVCHLVNLGYSAYPFNGNAGLNIPDNSVDLILALFVFQFSFSSYQVDELTRVLGQSGLIVANMYRRSTESRAQLQVMFTENGFNLEIVTLDDGIGYGHEYWLIGRKLDSERCALTIESLNKLSRTTDT